ncbi:MAG: tetratricopeptide repeat protein [Spirochaetota bacterium]
MGRTGRKRQKAIIFMFPAAIALLAAGLYFIALRPAGQHNGKEASQVTRASVAEAWGRQDAQKTLELAAAGLAANPFEPFFLSFHGIASYYASLGKPEGNDRQILLDQAVFSLRKALALGETLSVRPQIEYVLGKAYYQKGQPWFDLALKHLETAKDKGYKASDLDQYLGLANIGLFRHARAVDHFEKAIQTNPSDVLMLLAALSYKEMGDDEKAASFLSRAITEARDAVVTQRARFLSAEIALSQGSVAGAEEHYNAILAADPKSAEAWYGIGMVYESQGDPIKARSAWRKAIGIDPNHAEARKKLTEKL